MSEHNRISSYSKIYHLGHRAVVDLFKDPVIVQEKVDGSQISWSVIGGELYCRSRNQPLDLDNPHKLFALAVETIKSKISLFVPDWVYRAEAVTSPRHNVLQYNRIPAGGLVVYDIDKRGQNYLTLDELSDECARLGLECVPAFQPAQSWSKENLLTYLEHESFLGGVKIEGVVIKNYNRFTIDAKTLMSKYVSEAFKETMRAKGPKPGKKEAILGIIDHFKTEARWNKAVQHLRENGELEDDPKDIGKLMKELNTDFISECEDELKNLLLVAFRKDIIKGVVSGFPEFYKNLLMEKQFES